MMMLGSQDTGESGSTTPTVHETSEASQVTQLRKEVTQLQQTQAADAIEQAQSQVRVLAGAGSSREVIFTAVDNLVSVAMKYRHPDLQLYKDLRSQHQDHPLTRYVYQY